MNDLEELKTEIRRFAADRQWERFHSPKNLAMAVASEAGELLAEFRWLEDSAAISSRLSPQKRQAVQSEIADVLIFLIRLADVLDIELVGAVREKMKLNLERFPVSGPEVRDVDKY